MRQASFDLDEAPVIPPMLCFDLDGTLLNDQGRIHPRDVDILAAMSHLSGENKAVFLPTTGRPLHSIRSTFNRHGLFVKGSLPLPLVLLNGSLLFAPGERLVSYTPFSEELQQELLSLARPTTRTTILLLNLDEIYAIHPNAFGLAAAEQYDFQVQTMNRDCHQIPFGKMMVISSEPGELERLYQRTAGLDVERAYSMATILEFTPHGVNKAQGVRLLQKALGLEASPIYAAGDGGNDLALFAIAQASFAPLRSPAKVRQMANQVIDTCETGVLAPMLAAAEWKNPIV